MAAATVLGVLCWLFLYQLLDIRYAREKYGMGRASTRLRTLAMYSTWYISAPIYPALQCDLSSAGQLQCLNAANKANLIAMRNKQPLF